MFDFFFTMSMLVILSFLSCRCFSLHFECLTVSRRWLLWYRWETNGLTLGQKWR